MADNIGIIFGRVFKDIETIKPQLSGYRTEIPYFRNRTTSFTVVADLKIEIDTGSGYELFCQRAWYWRTDGEFERGSKSDNIAYKENTIQLSL